MARGCEGEAGCLGGVWGVGTGGIGGWICGGAIWGVVLVVFMRGPRKLVVGSEGGTREKVVGIMGFGDYEMSPCRSALL